MGRIGRAVEDDADRVGVVGRISISISHFSQSYHHYTAVCHELRRVIIKASREILMKSVIHHADLAKGDLSSKQGYSLKSLSVLCSFPFFEYVICNT